MVVTLGIVSMTTLSTAVLVVWFVLGVVSVRLFGFTPGQFAFGLTVVPVDGRVHVGVGRARRARPADRAWWFPRCSPTRRRGLQDRVTDTAVVRR